MFSKVYVNTYTSLHNPHENLSLIRFGTGGARTLKQYDQRGGSSGIDDGVNFAIKRTCRSCHTADPVCIFCLKTAIAYNPNIAPSA